MTATTTALAPAHTIRRLYLKGASVEVPHMDRMPRTPVQPVIGIDVQTEAHEGWPGTIECVLRMALQARVGATVAFVIEVNEAGVFELPGALTADELTRFVRKVAPAILFPMARRDLASLAVAAGFQPILLDHIDFDALVTQIVKRDWVRLTPAPVSVSTNVLAAAEAARMQILSPATPGPALRVDPTVPPRPGAAMSAPQQDAPDTEPGAPDTEPGAVAPEPSWLDTQPLPVYRPRARIATAGLTLAALGAAVAVGTWWWLQREPLQERALQARPAGAVSARPGDAGKPAPAVPMPKDAEPPAATRQALESSRERLAALPAGWRSIELGRMEADADLQALDVLPLQAPLYVVQLPERELQVLYGAFPSQEAALAALEETRGWKARGLRGAPRIVVAGRSS